MRKGWRSKSQSNTGCQMIIYHTIYEAVKSVTKLETRTTFLIHPYDSDCNDSKNLSSFMKGLSFLSITFIEFKRKLVLKYIQLKHNKNASIINPYSIPGSTSASVDAGMQWILVFKNLISMHFSL